MVRKEYSLPFGQRFGGGENSISPIVNCVDSSFLLEMENG
jgi:hypothetical protein